MSQIAGSVLHVLGVLDVPRVARCNGGAGCLGCYMSRVLDVPGVLDALGVLDVQGVLDFGNF